MAKKTPPELSVERDIQIGEIPEYLNLAIIGRFCGKTPGSAALKNWMEDNWKPVLGYTPSFHVLPRGWFMLKVSKEEERTLLLQKSCSWGPSGLILKKWHIDFNAQKEPHNLQQIWAILPNTSYDFLAKAHIRRDWKQNWKIYKTGGRMGIED